jgi:hypothetical protein
LGSAYLFDVNGTCLNKFEDPCEDDNARFGTSVASVGGNILIGATAAGANDCGAAYLFDGSTYSLLHTFDDPVRNRWDDFGASLAAVGTNILIGDTSVDNGRGAAYLFNGSPPYQLLQTFHDPNREADEQFGFCVAALGSNMLVGCKYDNTHTTDKVGSAYLFDANGMLLTTFDNPEPNYGDQFGCSIVAAGGNVLVGADADRNCAGSAYLFDANGNPLFTFLNPEPNMSDWFGTSIATVGDSLLIGAHGADVNGENAGAAYLFHKTGTALHVFTNPDPNEWDGFGIRVAAMGNNVLIAATDEDTGATDAGVVYLFEGDFILGDFEPDGDVDFADYVILAGQWRQPPVSPSADIAPGGGDGIVEWLDLKALCDNWLEGSE